MFHERLRRPRPRDVALALLFASACAREPIGEAPDPAPTLTPPVTTSAASLAIGGRCTAASIATGDNHACFVRANGAVACWGSSAAHQTGSLTTTPLTHPTDVPGLTGAVSVAGGTSHTCALLNDGTVRCWGLNSQGQLGNGATLASTAPVAVSGLTGVTAIAAGATHSCALKNDGTVWCWGSNASGRLGDNTTARRTTPVQAQGLTNATAITAGSTHTCAIAGGTVYCWGANNYGQLGDGTSAARRVPTPINMSPVPWRSIAAGAAHTCGVAQVAGNPVICWGRNNSGQLGDLTTVASRSTPGAAYDLGGSQLTDAVMVSAGGSSSCAIFGSSFAKCWGSNAQGQLGDSSVTLRRGASLVAAQSPLGSRFLSIANGLSHACAVDLDGDIFCWGANNLGQLGDGTQVRKLSPVMTGAELARPFASFSAEDRLAPTNGAEATSLLATADTLLAAGVTHQGFDSWVVRRSRDRGANWATVATWSFESGSAMDAPHLARRDDGTIFLAGSAENDDGDVHWLVRSSSDSGDTWDSSDDFALAPHRPAHANAITTSGSSAYVAGWADDGSARHWIVRKEAGGAWSTVDDYTHVGSSIAEAVALADVEGLGQFVVGRYRTTADHLVVRHGTNWGGFVTALDYQLQGGRDTVPVGVAADLNGFVYVLARGDAGDGKPRWIVLRSFEGGAFEYFNDLMLDDQTWDTAEPAGIYVDHAGAVVAFGQAARDGQALHAIVRISYNHGETWLLADELPSNAESNLTSAAEDTTGALHLVGSVAGTSATEWTTRSRSCLGLVPGCGNGVLDPGENCDGDCSDCNDHDVCTVDLMTGSPGVCSVSCAHTQITACVSGDGCCAPGCDETNDLDCCLDPVVNGVCQDQSFKLLDLDGSTCTVIEHNALAQGERGGLAVSSSNVFYTGSGTKSAPVTSRYNATDLLGGRATGKGWDAIVSDLKTGAIYSLANGSTALTRKAGIANTLIVLDPATGLATTTRIALSQAITVPATGLAFFSGYGRFLLHNGSHVFDVWLPSGQVRDLGAMTMPQHTACSTWAFWGVAESYDATYYLDYIDGSTIYRSRVPDGLTTPIKAFADLGAMCNFSVSPSRDRWYFHVHGDSQFRKGSNTLGFCSARFGQPNLTQVCGDGVVENGELCDGDCPTSCGDGLSCTTDVLTGSGCNRACVHAEVAACANGDGCCPAGCTTANDSDCPTCGDGVVQPGEGCDDGNTTSGDGCNSSCAVELPECTGYTLLSDVSRNVTSHLFLQSYCDSNNILLGNGWTDGWYRFTGDAGTQMPTTPADTRTCSSIGAGWWNGPMPTATAPRAYGTVCFNTNANPCYWSTSGEVTYCGAYYVYHLPPTPVCPTRYCGTN